MASPQVNWAADVIARRIAANALAAFEPLWEDYHEIGEDDWMRVSKRVIDLGEEMNPLAEETDTAYRFLASRAEHR